MDINWDWDQDDIFLEENLPADILDRKNMQNIFMKYPLLVEKNLIL